MNTWRTLWGIYVSNAELEAWTQAHRARIVEALVPDPYDWKGKKITKAIAPVGPFEIHAENARAFARIIAAKRAALDAKTDRQLAKRADTLGDLFARAPKKFSFRHDDHDLGG